MSNFKVKMHQILFRLGLRWGSLQRSLAGFKGPTCKGREGWGMGVEREGWRRGREGRGGEGKGKGRKGPPRFG